MLSGANTCSHTIVLGSTNTPDAASKCIGELGELYARGRPDPDVVADRCALVTDHQPFIVTAADGASDGAPDAANEKCIGELRELYGYL